METIQSFIDTFPLFREPTIEEFKNSNWQRKNTVTNIKSLLKVITLTKEEKENLFQNSLMLNIKITPYMFFLMKKESSGLIDKNCPIARQFIPYEEKLISIPEIQWESEDDLKKSYQDKYDSSRVILRMTSACIGYCNRFCFEGVRTIKTNSIHKKGMKINYLKEELGSYRGSNLQEIILSGGDPLIFKPKVLEQYLKVIREGLGDILIRINTRGPIFNPFILKEFVEIFKKYKVNSLGLHVVHPNEIQDELESEILALKTENPRLEIFTQFPLLRNINDDANILKSLCLKSLKVLGATPRYMYHTMPESIFSSSRVEWKKAERLAEEICSVKQPSSLRPLFTVVNKDGKFFPSVVGEKNYKIEKDYISYINWKNQNTRYPI